jgi:ferredoxin
MARGARAMVDKVRRGNNAPEPLEAMVRFVDVNGKELANENVPTGISILALSERLKVEIDHYCGGQCSCGTCRINVINGAKNLSAMDGMEEMVLGAANIQKGCRLACQARVQGPVEIEIPRWF